MFFLLVIRLNQGRKRCATNGWSSQRTVYRGWDQGPTSPTHNRMSIHQIVTKRENCHKMGKSELFSHWLEQAPPSGIQLWTQATVNTARQQKKKTHFRDPIFLQLQYKFFHRQFKKEIYKNVNNKKQNTMCRESQKFSKDNFS